MKQKLIAYAPTVLRVGLGAVFIWFGYDQFAHTANWVDFVPDYVVSLSGLSSHALVLLNAVLELVAGTALVVGFYTHFFALILALHLVEITITVGFNALGVRDFGLTIATAASAMLGSGPLSLDGE
jgi:uncharacterized membrane protein YphA (DoxX/SURF4 family)